MADFPSYGDVKMVLMDTTGSNHRVTE